MMEIGPIVHPDGRRLKPGWMRTIEDPFNPRLPVRTNMIETARCHAMRRLDLLREAKR